MKNSRNKQNLKFLSELYEIIGYKKISKYLLEIGNEENIKNKICFYTRLIEWEISRRPEFEILGEIYNKKNLVKEDLR